MNYTLQKIDKMSKRKLKIMNLYGCFTNCSSITYNDSNNSYWLRSFYK